MKFSITGQENGDLSIQVTAWVGLTVTLYINTIDNCYLLLTSMEYNLSHTNLYYTVANLPPIPHLWFNI